MAIPAYEPAESAAGEDPQALPQSGHVKSWNGAKGYGFITCDSMSGDIMFSKRELPEDVREVQGTFLKGRPVAFNAMASPDGRIKASAVQVLVVEGKPLPGCVKSWSDRNGYGFITSSSLADDVRFSRLDMPQVGLGTNLQGQLVTFSVKSRPDGKLMAQGVQFQSGQTAMSLQAAQPMMQMPVMQQPMMWQQQPVARPVAPRPASVQPRPMFSAQGRPAGFSHDRSSASGVVKSYSERNRYGFINVPGQQGDVKFGQLDLADPTYVPEQGTQVSFSMLKAADGRVQARDVRPSGGGGVPGKRVATQQGSALMFLAAEQPQPGKRPRPTPTAGGNSGAGAGAGGGFGAGAGSVPTGQETVGVVKSFNVAKGFGFITSDDAPTDVYFGSAVLSPELASLAAELVGARVSCELTVAPDGKIRAQSLQLV